MIITFIGPRTTAGSEVPAMSNYTGRGETSTVYANHRERGRADSTWRNSWECR